MTLTANDCPSCQQLQRDLAACQERAERAERERDEAETRAEEASNLYAKEFVARKAAEANLAAARGERDRLRDALEGALQLCGRCGGKGQQWASAAFDEAGRMTKAYKPCPDCTPFRAALEKANG